MKWNAIVCALALTTGFVSSQSTPSLADSGFRCGTGRIVQAGDHMYEVRDRCGEPDAVTTRVVKRTVRQKVVRWVANAAEEVEEERQVDVILDEWVYDLGETRFVRYVAFENDRVIDVATGSRGTKRR
jgi:hypothetical protein